LRVLVINNLDLPFPPGLRLEKEYRALVDAGHQVLIVAQKNAIDKNSHKFNILDIDHYKRSLIKKILFKLVWDDYGLRKEIVKLISDFSPDIVLGIDLQWSHFAYKVAKEYKAKFVVDFLENMPAAVQTHLKSEKPLIRYIKILSGLYRKNRLIKYEERTFSQADLVFVVIEEAYARFQQKDTDGKVLVVKNTELPEKWDYQPQRSKRQENLLKLTYVGGIGEHRGIDTLIHSTKFIKGKDYHISIIGFDTASYCYKKMCKLVLDAGKENFVTLKGKIPFTEVEKILLNSDVLVIPHNSSEHTNTTVPHKLFQYMCVGKPVLVSDVKPLKRIVEECDCGVVFKADDPVDCAEMIDWCISNAPSLLAKGNNARKAAIEKYNWALDSSVFVNQLERITKNESSR